MKIERMIYINIKNNKTLNLIIILCSLLLPILSIIYVIHPSRLFDPFRVLWVGFYSSIIMITCFEKKTINKILIGINICFIFFVFVLSLMGGIQGILATFIRMLFPFISEEWLWGVIVKILPLNY